MSKMAHTDDWKDSDFDKYIGESFKNSIRNNNTRMFVVRASLSQLGRLQTLSCLFYVSHQYKPIVLQIDLHGETVITGPPCLLVALHQMDAHANKNQILLVRSLAVRQSSSLTTICLATDLDF